MDASVGDVGGDCDLDLVAARLPAAVEFRRAGVPIYTQALLVQWPLHERLTNVADAIVR